MIELLRIRVSYLNGSNITRYHRLDTQRMFNSKQELEDYRKLKELKLQYKANSKGDREVKVSVSFDYREPCQQ